MNHKGTVLVGLSGGIDSSVAAYILKKQGYNVIGITIKVWNDVSKCCSAEDMIHAALICKKLNIPYYIIDSQDRFKKFVIKYFIDSYTSGETPNPCMYCNKDIKFPIMYDLLKKYKGDLIATGHYAELAKFNDTILIKKGRDKKKDQSYFLALLDEKIRSKLLFPLSKIIKNDTKKIYEEFFGHPFEKKESQDLCFVENGHYGDFIEKNSNFKSKSGNIIFNKKIVGKHKGYIFYTVGQRKHLGVAYSEPLYIKKINAEKNEIILDTKNHIVKNKIYLRAPIFHLNTTELLNLPLTVKLHYRSKDHKARLISKNDRFFLDISEDPQIVSPGQLAVLYHKDLVVGAGWQ